MPRTFLAQFEALDMVLWQLGCSRRRGGEGAPPRGSSRLRHQRLGRHSVSSFCCNGLAVRRRAHSRQWSAGWRSGLPLRGAPRPLRGACEGSGAADPQGWRHSGRCRFHAQRHRPVPCSRALRQYANCGKTCPTPWACHPGADNAILLLSFAPFRGGGMRLRPDGQIGGHR
jgi:hypothetical protein